MIKAPLDEKNICPSVIVEDLTLSNCVFRDCNAVGFINDTPVLFKWYNNVLSIIFERVENRNKNLKTLEDYVKDMEECTQQLRVSKIDLDKEMRWIFYWKEEELLKNKSD